MENEMYFDEASLLSTPVLRAAYSDRTAWLMAEMSRLAYFKFEGDSGLESLVDGLMKLNNKAEFLLKAKQMLIASKSSPEEAENELQNYLEVADFKLIKTFNKNNSQAFLVHREVDNMAILSFRGTEMNIADIKTDLKRTMIEIDGYRVHEGFYNAYKDLESDIKQHINTFSKDTILYITGHSLGGALALLATKYLCSDSVGACYTFGGPRIASEDFSQNIKTPIYRVVNAADSVPRLPLAFLPRLLVGVLPFLPVPYLRRLLITYFKRLIGYRHHGDMRQLTACKPDCSDLRLLSNPNIIDRSKRLLIQWINTWGKSAVADHNIKVYCHKLKSYALRRQ